MRSVLHPRSCPALLGRRERRLPVCCHVLRPCTMIRPHRHWPSLPLILDRLSLHQQVPLHRSGLLKEAHRRHPHLRRTGADDPQKVAILHLMIAGSYSSASFHPETACQ